MKKQKASKQWIEQLFRDCFRPLTVFAIQYVNDKSVAEDIVQELFLYVYEHFCEKGEDVPSNYLYTLVRYRCLNHLAHQKIRTERQQDIEKSYGHPHDPMEIVETLELEHSYLQAVESLPRKCREVYRMSRFKGKNNQEISDELSLSKRTVERHITNALQTIRQKLIHLLMALVVFSGLIEITYACIDLVNCIY